MTISPDKINTTFTLEMDSNEVPADKFLKTSTAFVHLLQHLSSICKEEEETINWQVKVQQGSEIFGISPCGSYNAGSLAKVENLYKKGVLSVVKGELPPKEFDTKALKDLHTIAENLKGKGSNVIPLRLWAGKSPFKFEQETYEFITSLLESYQDYGSISGEVQLLSKTQKQRKFSIFDDVTNIRIKGSCNSEIFKTLSKNFGKRIEAFGEIKFSKDGEPTHILMEDYTVFEEGDNTPSLYDLQKWLRASNG